MLKNKHHSQIIESESVKDLIPDEERCLNQSMIQDSDYKRLKKNVLINFFIFIHIC